MLRDHPDDDSEKRQDDAEPREIAVGDAIISMNEEFAWPRRLTDYLAKLERRYRPRDCPRPDSDSALERETRGGVFNAEYVLRVLGGAPGPGWGTAKPVRLPFALHRLRRLRDAEASRKQQYVDMRLRDRAIVSIINRLHRIPFYTPGRRKQIVEWLAEERGLGPGRLKSLLPAREQAAWVTPLACALTNYLKRTTRESGRSVDTIASRILSYASRTRVTAAMVKDRAWRATGQK